MFSTEQDAKRYLVDRIVAQAAAEGVPLSEAERHMLAWSEADPEFAMDPTLPVRLAAEISDEDYEAKIGGLLDRACRADAVADKAAVERYQNAVSVLGRGDHYLSIIAERSLKRYLRPWWKFSWT